MACCQGCFPSVPAPFDERTVFALWLLHARERAQSREANRAYQAAHGTEVTKGPRKTLGTALSDLKEASTAERARQLGWDKASMSQSEFYSRQAANDQSRRRHEEEKLWRDLRTASPLYQERILTHRPTSPQGTSTKQGDNRADTAARASRWARFPPPRQRRMSSTNPM